MKLGWPVPRRIMPGERGFPAVKRKLLARVWILLPLQPASFSITSTIGGRLVLADLEVIFSKAAGKGVSSAYIPDEVFLSQMGMAPDTYKAQTLLTLFRHYNTHSFCRNNRVLTQILGREPRTLDEFVKENM